jgi:uncharacterized metal-binding protein YceD (DUF177 family)
MVAAMSAASPPYSHPVELAGISDQGVELSLAPAADERARIAAWMGILELVSLDARVRLMHVKDDDYSYEAEYRAEVLQSCVVTLDPVRAAHAGALSRLYRVARPPSRRAAREMVVASEGDEDAPEVLSGSLLDIAAPVLEELTLALDPYPRAPGVAFEPPKEEVKASDSPFAVLAKLKDRSPGGSEPGP